MSTITRRPYADTAEDVEFILMHDPTTTCMAIAERLGLKGTTSIYTALKWVGRHDLHDQLKRNAEVAE